MAARGGRRGYQPTREYLEDRRRRNTIGLNMDEQDNDDEDVRQVANTSNPQVGLSAESIYDETKQIERTFVVTLTGSASSFDADGRLASSPLVTHASALHYLKGVPGAGGKLDYGDPSRSFITKACVLRVTNDFPFDIVLSSENLHGNYVVSGATEGHQTGFLVAPKAQTFIPPKHTADIRCKPRLSTKFLSKYGHVTSESAMEGVYEHPKNKGDWHIPLHNPLLDIIQLNHKDPITGAANFQIKAYHVDGKMNGYIVDLETLDKARDAFKDYVLPMVPIVDLSRLTINAQRAGQTWAAPIPGIDTPEIFDTPFSITVVLNLTYRLMFESEIPK